MAAGFFGGTALAVFYRALSAGNMGLTAPVAAVLGAAIPTLVDAFIEGIPGPVRLAGFVLAGIGIWLISKSDGTTEHQAGIGLAALAGIGFAGYFLCTRQAGAGSPLMDRSGGALRLLDRDRRNHASYTAVRADERDWRSMGATGLGAGRLGQCILYLCEPEGEAGYGRDGQFALSGVYGSAGTDCFERAVHAVEGGGARGGAAGGADDCFVARSGRARRPSLHLRTCDTEFMQSPLKTPSASTDPKSVKVNLTSGTGMEIEWRDGHLSVYTFPFLRDACPCAMCNDEREKSGRQYGEPVNPRLVRCPCSRRPRGRSRPRASANTPSSSNGMTRTIWGFTPGVFCGKCAHARNATRNGSR